MKLNIFKNKNTNIEKLNKKYQSQKYLAKKDFNQLNPNLVTLFLSCLLYTSDAADEDSSV